MRGYPLLGVPQTGPGFISLSVSVDVRAALGTIDQSHKQAPYAIAVALTRTAQQARRDVQTRMRTVFDRPTPYAINSVFVQPANKITLTARVWLKDDRAGSGTPATKYLGPQVFGGARGIKGFEKLLQRRGLMPSGWVAIPGNGARLDAYGNMSRGQIVQLLASLGAMFEPTSNTTEASRRRNKKPRDYFVSGPRIAARTSNGGRLPFGVYERRARSITTVLRFRPRAEYKVRLPFHAVVNDTVRRVFPAELQRSWAQALATAR